MNGIDQARLFDIINYQLENFPQAISLARKADGVWKKYSTQEVIDISHQVSAGLLSKGIVPGDKVAIISTTNRPEWNFIDLGVLQIGAVDVPIYPTITAREYAYVLNDSGCKMAFVSDQEVYEKIKNVAHECSALKEIYLFDEVSGSAHWTSILENDLVKAKETVQPFKDKVNHKDLATLIYTSGTTGDPKGVMLSDENIVSNVLASSERLPLIPGSRSLSFLPLCHIFERMLIYLYAYKGANIYYAQSLETIGDDMKEVKPHIFSAVPRLLEKVFSKIIAKGKELTGIKKTLFFWAVRLAERFEYYGKNGVIYDMKLAIARKLIFSKWKEALGGEVQLAASGSAALSPRLNRIFNAAGIPVMEGFGLTETSPVISVNEIDNEGVRFGTCGRPLFNVEVKIAKDGEILCKGPNVMMGYYNKPEMTAEVIDKDGWFHTGDIGELVDGQFLKITDRKKEIFKTSGGKYVAPQIMENVFKQSSLIEQIMVIGENKKHPSALIVPNFASLSHLCKEKNIKFSSDGDAIHDPLILQIYQEVLDTYNAEFNQWEQVKKFALLDKEWSIDGGELTPTLKLRRKKVFEKYSELIDKIYSEED
jgi:long-chain acyl-CoA synthetase